MVANSRFIILFAAYQKVPSTPGTQKTRCAETRFFPLKSRAPYN
jgi:hypothetical protein